jgi:hypothetical protein
LKWQDGATLYSGEEVEKALQNTRGGVTG